MAEAGNEYEESIADQPEEYDGVDPYFASGGEDVHGYRGRRSEHFRAARAAEAQAVAAGSLACDESVALGYKDSGNSAYGSKDYLGAAGLYTLALESLPSTAPSCLRRPQAAPAALEEGGEGGAGSAAAGAGEAVAGASAAGGGGAPQDSQPEPSAQEVLRATCYCNRAACHVALNQWEDALWDCDRALELKPAYTKAHSRRAAALEHLSLLDEALADFQAATVQDPASAPTLAKDIERVKKLIEARDEKLKVRGPRANRSTSSQIHLLPLYLCILRIAPPPPPLRCSRRPQTRFRCPPRLFFQEDMFGKLKDLGNSLLGKFGMSLDNFKAVKDPATGSYSISFQQ
jgi:tetratricopeptide (TPR) repeat protein